MQTNDVIAWLGKHTSVTCDILCGGSPEHNDMAKLREGMVQIAVGTPGRVLSMSRYGALADKIEMNAAAQEQEGEIDRTHSICHQR